MWIRGTNHWNQLAAAAIALWLFFLSLPVPVFSQQADEATISRVKKELDDLFEDWRAIMTEGSVAVTKYLHGERVDAPAQKKNWESAFDKGLAKKESIEEKICELFFLVDKPDNELASLVGKVIIDANSNSQMSRVYRLSKRLLEFNPESDDLRKIIGRSYIVTNHFDEADQFVKNFGTLVNDFDETTKYLYGELDNFKKAFAEEQKLQQAEAAVDDLPRVLLKTSRGNIVLELFENEMPDTVGNFVSLVEKGFYNGTVFHRVINEFMAQGGDPTASGMGGPGYTIYDEFGAKAQRHHFSYVISMANAGANTGGSQFFITFRPAFELDDKHPVFGRVIEGFEAVDKLTRTYDGETPIKGAKMDRIITATVLRKRNHDYAPNKSSSNAPAPPADDHADHKHEK